MSPIYKRDKFKISLNFLNSDYTTDMVINDHQWFCCGQTLGILMAERSLVNANHTLKEEVIKL